LEIDVFDLAARLGQSEYKKPSEVLRKLTLGLEELVAKRFLQSFEMVKKGQFSRLKFVRTDGVSFAKSQQNSREKEVSVSALRTAYQTSENEVAVWKQVKRVLRAKLSSAQYAILDGAELLSLDVKQAVVCLPHAFAVAWVKSHSEFVVEVQSALAKHVNSQQLQVQWVDQRVEKSVGLDEVESD
jgi:hypothetical protein